MSGQNNIRVVCRFRPQNQRELSSGGKNIIHTSSDKLATTIKGESEHTFAFDRVYGPETTQKELFDDCAKPIIEDIFKGYNGTIFVYGQTSSGKTHTMMGPDGGKGMDDPNQKGIIPRIIVGLFENIFKSSEDIEFLVKVSYVEIYMERIRDLLDISKENLAIREDKAKNIWIEDVTEVYVGSDSEVVDVMKQGTSNRSIAATKMNAESSRSHSLFIISIQQKNIKSQSSRTGKLFLVDLAGSEKISKTGAEGQTLEEAKMINKSLSTLGNVINALTDGKSTHVPYRDSKLTRILQESLGGNSRTTLIINCSPSSYNEAETLSTLRFGSRAKNIKNKAKINQELSATELKLRLAAAEKEIERLKAHIAAGGGPLPAEGAGSHETLEELKARLADVEAQVKDTEEQNRLMENDIEALTTKLADKEQEIEALRDELKSVKASEEAAQKALAEKTKAVEDEKIANEKLRFDLSERQLTIDSLSALNANATSEMAALQKASEALRAEIAQKEKDAEEARELLQLRVKEWEREKQERQAGAAANAPAAGRKKSLDELSQWESKGQVLKQSLQNDIHALDALQQSLHPGAGVANLQALAASAQSSVANIATDAQQVQQIVGGTPTDSDEVAKLRAEVQRLNGLLKEKEAGAADERVRRLEGDLEELRQATAKKLAEFDGLKSVLMRDLRARCEKVVDLEMLLDEAREQYEELVKSASWKAAHQKNEMLMQALEAARAQNQKALNEIHTMKLEREISEKKLAARNERIASLEGVIQTAQEKLLAQQTTHQAEIAKYRSVIDALKVKGGPLAAPHARIAKPIKGGAKSSASSGAAEEDAGAAESSESGGFWSLFRPSPSKKNLNLYVSSPAKDAAPAVSPRKEPPSTPAKPNQP